MHQKRLETRNARIGVVLPSFNAARFLREAIASVKRQTVAAEKIVVVDDCSTDESVEVARAAGVHVVQQTRNSGPGSARNRGVAELGAVDLVAFLDADDLWAPDHLELLVAPFNDPSVGLAFSRESVLGRTVAPSSRSATSKTANMFEDLLDGNFISQSGVVVRRSVFLESGGYAEGSRYAEDYELWMRVASFTDFASVAAVTSFWRKHEANTSQNSAKMLEGALAARKAALRFAEGRGRAVAASRLAKANQEMLGRVLDAAAYNADRSVLDVLRREFSAATPEGEVIRLWEKRYLPRWPMLVLKRRLREWLYG